MNDERGTSADATERKMERCRMLVERQRTERKRRADAKGKRSCQERYFYCN